MDFYSSYYEILGIPQDSSLEEIKTAFRKQVIICHPDKNNNSPESEAEFIILYNAYSILSDPDKRKEYDSYLRSSSAFYNWKIKAGHNRNILAGKTGELDKSNKALLNYFNFLLWDIEDFIHDKKDTDWEQKYSDIPLRQYILMILAFMDKWVLIPAGFPDYFREARKMERIDPLEYIKDTGVNNNRSGHRPFTSVADYFYDIRKRLNKFLKSSKVNELMENIPDHNIRLIDCIVEVQNYTIHYLGYLLQRQSDGLKNIPVFQYSNPCFSIQKDL